MSTYTICTRCGKQVLPFDTVGTGTGPTIGYCACQPQTGWGNPAPLTPLIDWRDAELARLRAENTVLRDTLVKANELHEKTIAGSAENERAWTAAMAEAERERDEARKRSETLWNILRVKIDGEKSDIGRDYYEKDTRSWSQYRRKQRHNDAERGQAGKE